MNVVNVVVHILNKKQATKDDPTPKASIDFAVKLLDTSNETVKNFSEKLAMTYFDKKSRFYTKFKKTESLPTFQENLNKLIDNTYDFYKYSRVITDKLKDEMDSERMSTGGYLIIMEYESKNKNRYLFVALLNNKIEYSIDDTLKLNQFLSLNIDKMAMASVINLSNYGISKDNYITFLKGLRDIPDYFIKFIGADKDIKRDLKIQTRNWVNAINDYLTEEKLTLEEIKLKIQEMAKNVKDIKAKEELITAEIIANIIEPTNPEKFIEFVYDEEKEYELNSEMETMDTSFLNNYGIIKYENRKKDFLLKFPQKSEGDIISYDEESDTFSITDKEIVKGIKSEIDINKNIKQ